MSRRKGWVLLFGNESGTCDAFFSKTQQESNGQNLRMSISRKVFAPGGLTKRKDDSLKKENVNQS